MPITSLQRLLGHEKLAMALVYARVHSEIVRCDHERARARLSSERMMAGEAFDALSCNGKPQLAKADTS